MIGGTEPSGTTKLVRAGTWAVQGEAESWVCAVGVMAKRVYTAVSSSQLGWWREGREGLSSEVPSDGTSDDSPSWDKRKSYKIQGSVFFPMRWSNPGTGV